MDFVAPLPKSARILVLSHANVPALSVANVSAASPSELWRPFCAVEAAAKDLSTPPFLIATRAHSPQELTRWKQRTGNLSNRHKMHSTKKPPVPVPSKTEGSQAEGPVPGIDSKPLPAGFETSDAALLRAKRGLRSFRPLEAHRAVDSRRRGLHIS
jgi:hypothetical protein